MPDEHPTRLGVLGGTFDPIHNGHLAAGAAVKDALTLDQVMFVPAGNPWQKRDFSDAEDRFMMAVLATSDRPGFVVSRIEIDGRGPTYTIDTLRMLHDLHPSTELYFIGGADTFAGAKTWNRFEQIGDLATFVIVDRPGTDMAALPLDDSWPEVAHVEMEPVDISATDIRERVRRQEPIDGLVPERVATYIRENGLYLGAGEEAS